MIDIRPLHRHGRHTVLTESHLVAWADGSTLRLHLVANGGGLDPLLRAWHCTGPGAAAAPDGSGTWWLLDLPRVLPHLAADIRVRESRDAFGLIYYTLRLEYASAAGFLDAVRGSCTPLAAAREYGIDVDQARADPAADPASTPSPAARAGKGTAKRRARSAAGAAAASADEGAAGHRSERAKARIQTDDAGCAGGRDARTGDLFGK